MAYFGVCMAVCIPIGGFTPPPELTRSHWGASLRTGGVSWRHQRSRWRSDGGMVKSCQRFVQDWKYPMGAYCGKSAGQRLKRHRRSGFVVLVGPDGSGKSTVARRYVAEAATNGRLVEVVNFRAGIVDGRRRARKATGDQSMASTPHEVVERGLLGAHAKAFVLWFDLVLSGFKWNRSAHGSHEILVERYAYDLAVDPGRLGISAVPFRVRSLMARSVPAPRLVVVCRALAEEIVERKPELPHAEIQRQLKAWADPVFVQRSVPIRFLDTSAGADANWSSF